MSSVPTRSCSRIALRHFRTTKAVSYPAAGLMQPQLPKHILMGAKEVGVASTISSARTATTGIVPGGSHVRAARGDLQKATGVPRTRSVQRPHCGSRRHHPHVDRFVLVPANSTTNPPGRRIVSRGRHRSRWGRPPAGHTQVALAGPGVLAGTQRHARPRDTQLLPLNWASSH